MTETVIEIVDLESEYFIYKSQEPSSGHNKRTPISVENYESRIKKSCFINLDDEYNDDDEIQILSFKNTKKPFTYPSVSEPGESSVSVSKSNSINTSSTVSRIPRTCEICVEPKQRKEFFNIKGCKHSYCNECMSRYVASKIQDNMIVINCPETNCEGVLELEFCRDILPREVFDRWGNALCENLILGAEKFYCPFKDCSALLIDDGGVTVKESECPHCRRMFCAQCKVPWHVGIVCEEFQKLGKGEREREDIMLMKLAKDKKWQRCPKCKIFVERSDGCLFMKCRVTPNGKIPSRLQLLPETKRFAEQMELMINLVKRLKLMVLLMKKKITCRSQVSNRRRRSL